MIHTRRPASLFVPMLALAAVLAITAPPSNAHPSAQPLPPAVAYVHLSTLGTSGLPWQRSAAYLNQPWGVGADGDGAWVAAAAGRNLLRFGVGPLQELGRAGSLDELWEKPTRWPADVVAVGLPGSAASRRVWFVDRDAHVVVGLPIESDGVAGPATVLGEAGVPGDAPGRFRSPTGLAIAPSGEVYVSDTGNHRVQLFDAAGAVIATIGQTGRPGAANDQLHDPARLALGADGTLFVADAGNHRVQSFDVRNPRAPRYLRSYGRTGLPGAAADQLDTPLGVAVDATFLYVADSGNGRVQILRRSDGQLWRTLDGGVAAACGHDDPGDRWDLVSDVALTADGTLYVALPRRMQVQVCDAASRGPRRVHGTRDVPYLASDELYNAPAGVALAPDGALTLVEREGHRVLRRAPDGSVTWRFGVAGVAGADDAHLAGPVDVALLPDGRTVVADAGNGRLVVLDVVGRYTESWGEGLLSSPTGLALLADGRLAVADSALGRLFVFDGAGNVLGAPPLPAMAAPTDVAVDARGSWYVTDAGTQQLLRFDAAGSLTGAVGSPGVAGDDFGGLSGPRDVAVGADGRIFVADTGNHRVQVFDADLGYLTTLGGQAGSGTGGLREPSGVTLAADGRLFVADTYNQRVQVFQPASEPWLPDATNGFGVRTVAAVTALGEFGERLFAGTADDATGAAVWQRDATGPWQPAAVAGFAGPRQSAIATLAQHDAQLYAGTESRVLHRHPQTGLLSATTDGGELWRTADGRRWVRVVAAGFGEPGNAAVSALGSFGGQLYAGTRSLARAAEGGQAPQLWRSTQGDAGTWQRVRIDLANQAEWPKNGAISVLVAYGEAFLAGTCAADGAQLWSSPDGNTWRPVGDREDPADERTARPQLGSGAAACLTALVEYDGYLYAGIGNEPVEPGRYAVRPGAAELWRCRTCDGTDWEPVAAPGLDNPRNGGRVALAAFDEAPFRYLYAAVGNAAGGLEVWRAANGVDWEPLVPGGLGDDNNVDVANGQSLRVFGGRLRLATVNGAHGGELWSTAGTRPGIGPTPTLPGPSATPVPRPSPQPSTGPARYRRVAAWPAVPAAPGDVLGKPVDMAVGEDGMVYIADTAPARLLRLRPDGTWADPVGASGGGPGRLTEPVAVVVDDVADRVYVSDSGTDRVVIYDRAGAYRGVIPEVNARDLELRADGSLWVADLRAGSVRRLAPDGAELERFGAYGPDPLHEFRGLVAVSEDAAGVLWVADEDGRRLRAFERSGGSFQRQRLVDFSAPAWQGRGCDGVRLQSLAAGVVLAGACVLEDGAWRDSLPADHRGSDLYQVRLRTANLRAGRYTALADLDMDRDDSFNEVMPAVAYYQDEGFDLVIGSRRGRAYSLDTADPGALQDPAQVATLSDGSVVVSDGLGLRRFGPEGQLREDLPLSSVPGGSQISIDPRLVVATGESGRVMGVARLWYPTSRRPLDLQVLYYAQSQERRVCRDRVCRRATYLDPLWQTTLADNSQPRGAPDYNYAATFEPTRLQYVLLQLFSDRPSDLEQSARLLLFPKDGQGRKTELPLAGSDREALWTDVDAGPDGHIYVLDSLNDRVQVFAADGSDLGRLTTPKDAWKVAGGPHGDVFVLTIHGQVVRLAADGTVLARFLGLPDDGLPHTALADLAVDAWGRVYTVDTLYDQVTVFEPAGEAVAEPADGQCTLTGDKWGTPLDMLLGDTAELTLSLFGTCGAREEPADIVLAVAADYSVNESLRVARQILGLVDLDRHRAAVLSFAADAVTEEGLTVDRDRLVRALKAIPYGRQTACGANHNTALQEAERLLADRPERRKVLLLIPPGFEPQAGECPWDEQKVAATAARLKARGIIIVAVNGPSNAASGELLSNLYVAERGQGVGRPALRRALDSSWPADLVAAGTLSDQLPANIDYVLDSANPPALWDAASRTLSWPLAHLARNQEHRFTLRIRPQAEGLWPTNVAAEAEGKDGWGAAIRVVLPVPKVRVYGELPKATETPTQTTTGTATPTRTTTRTPEPTGVPVPVYLPVYLPVLLKTVACAPGSRNADVALVIDTSGSMSETTSPGGPTKLAAAQEAARAFLGQLQGGRDQAALIQFHQAATVIVPLTGDIGSVTAGLARLTQSSGTRIDLALATAGAEIAGPRRMPGNNLVVILLTDGEPSGATPDEVRAAANQARASGLLVFTIGLGPAVHQDLMRDVATIPEWFFFAPDTSDLASIYGQIAYEIPCQPEWP